MDFDNELRTGLPFTESKLTPILAVLRQDFIDPAQGNLLKGIDKKIGRREIIEPIKRVFTYFLFSILTYYCYYYEETRWLDIAGFYILYFLKFIYLWLYVI